jgi:Xaa-Pro aminopeptidase
MKMSELDREARRMLGEYSAYFTHSLGHWVGLEIHESPRVSGKSREILEYGMVITIEPGVYFWKIKNEKSQIRQGELRMKNEGISKIYGLRYEEMVFVDKDKLVVL